MGHRRDRGWTQGFMAGQGSRLLSLILLGVGLSLMPDQSGAGAIAATPIRNSAMPQPTTPQPTINFGRHFQALGVEGSILIYDARGDRTYEHNPQRNITAFPPASTFKIPNSLIALETGVITDELAVLTWDGIDRHSASWNRDLNLQEAFKRSAVWFYQVLARRVGYARMQKWVEQMGYGNQQLGNPGEIDTFWLEGKLRITPQQQIQFLRRLYGQPYGTPLPVSARSLAIVKQIMIAEQTPRYTLRAKTGWAGFGSTHTSQIGWYVGYLEQGNNVYFFATNLNIRQAPDAPARLEITRRCLQDLGLL